jgi:hypothetical protein
MTVGHPQFGTMCEICFAGLTEDECAEDVYGQKWDLCKGLCAQEAGIEERQPDRLPLVHRTQASVMRWREVKVVELPDRDVEEEGL